jgi:hypothetical protein
MAAEQPVLSAGQVIDFQPPGSGHVYQVAPLTFRERAAMRADLARFAGIYPEDGQLRATLRAALNALAPDNLAELLSVVDAAEAAPGDDAAQRALQDIEAICAMVPAYAELLAARNHYMTMVPFVTARHALRGWTGEGLPPFRRERGVVPEALLDVLPHADLTALGWLAHAMSIVGKSAVGNSVSPTPSPATRTRAKAGRGRRMAGAGS